MKHLNLKIPEHSYFFGFVQMDGNLDQLPRNRGHLAIEIKEGDGYILKSFKRLFPVVNSSIRIRVRDTNFKKNYTSHTLTICKKEFRDELIKLGFPNSKKSLIVSPPKTNFCERDYIRGLIDGDGSVGITKKGFPFISISVKSEALKKYLFSIVEHITGEKKRLSRNKRDNTYNIMLNREKAQKFIQYLYYPSCLALKRKLKKAQEALKWRRPKILKRIFKKFWEPREDKCILNHPIEESCSRLKRTERSIKMRLWRLNNHRAPYLKACLEKTKNI